MEEIKIIMTEDGSHSLFRKDLNETYHSFHGAMQESTYVFIKMGLEAYLEKYNVTQINVLEIGFGTGLNALLAAEFAEEHAVNIYFETLETIPLDSEIYQNLNYRNQSIGKELFLSLHECKWEKDVAITPHFTLKKIKQSLLEYQESPNFDVIFFDAFAPSKQPELWEKEVMEKMFKSLHKNGMFTTYCAKGQLKRDLKEVGLQVTTLPGAPGKKEMVRAEKA